MRARLLLGVLILAVLVLAAGGLVFGVGRKPSRARAAI
jgi:hypothetical protein